MVCVSLIASILSDLITSFSTIMIKYAFWTCGLKQYFVRNKSKQGFIFPRVMEDHFKLCVTGQDCFYTRIYFMIINKNLTVIKIKTAASA